MSTCTQDAASIGFQDDSYAEWLTRSGCNCNSRLQQRETRPWLPECVGKLSVKLHGSKTTAGGPASLTALVRRCSVSISGGM